MTYDLVLNASIQMRRSMTHLSDKVSWHAGKYILGTALIKVSVEILIVATLRDTERI